MKDWLPCRLLGPEAVCPGSLTPCRVAPLSGVHPGPFDCAQGRL
jgi:hypothetical protein